MLDIHARNEKLYSQLLELTKAVLIVLSKRIHSDLVVIDESQWHKSDEEIYIKKYIRKPLWVIVVHKCTEKIYSLSEYKECKEYIELDPIISPHLNTLVGSCLGSHRIEADSILLRPIYAFLTNEEIKAFDLHVFNSEYEKIENALYSDQIEYCNITPLCGFRMEHESVQITDNISLVKLSDDEVLEFLRLGLKLGYSMGNEDYIHGIHRFGIKIKYSFPKIIGESEKSFEEISSNKFFTNFHEKETVNALRVFKGGKFYPIASIKKSDSLFSIGVSFSLENPVGLFMNGQYTLNKDDDRVFAGFYTDISEGKLADNHFMSISIRRFSQSIARDDIEDRIIDLMISAEALFLSSGGGFQGELKYRLAHRATMLIGGDVGDQKYVFEFMQNAYDVRSSIVHGSTPKLPKKINGENYTLEEFCSDIEMYLRCSIKKIISLISSAPAKKKEIDWKSIMFPVSEIK